MDSMVHSVAYDVPLDLKPILRAVLLLLGTFRLSTVQHLNANQYLKF